MKVRAKFKVTKVSQVDWNPAIRVIELSAVSADGIPEHERFHKYTPAGSMSLTIDNPAAAEAFQLGKVMDVDFQVEGEA